MKILLTPLLAINLTLTFATSQFDYKTLQSDTVYSYSDVDTRPTLEKGMESLYKKWNSYAKYPSQARRNKIEGKVFLSFVVDEKGNITEPKVEQGLGYGCDEAAIEALLKTGLKWTPGIKDGKNVKVRMVLPFAFRLK
jgi:periplasmic protein TonB